MKITRVHEITVSGNSKIHRTLRDIALGGRVSAEILERLDGNKAVLHFSDTKIVAQFLKEIPRGKHVELVLTSRQKNTYTFALISDKRDVSAPGKYQQFITVDDGKAQANLYRIRALLGEGHSLYDINRHLSGITSQSAGGAFIGFLNALLKKGMSRKDTEKIAAILLKLKGGSSWLIASIIMATDADSALSQKKALANFDESITGEAAGYLKDVLENLVWDDELRDHFGKILAWLSGRCREEESEQKIPVYDDEKYIDARLIAQGDSIACELELSELGRLEIFAMVLGGAISISIVCESDKSVEILTRDLYHLQKKLHSVIKNGAMVAVFRAKEARGLVSEEVETLLLETRVDVHV